MKLASVTFDKETVQLGDVLTISAVLLNDAKAPASSQTPTDAHAYDETETFQANYAPMDGLFRLAVGTAPQLTSLNWPYRWGWKGVLAPGGQVTVVGKVHITVPTGALWFAAVVLGRSQIIGAPVYKAIPFGAPAGGGGGTVDQTARDAIEQVVNGLHSI